MVVNTSARHCKPIPCVEVQLMNHDRCFWVRLFVDVKNGEPIPRKSILKSRSRENSVCSDTSESSAADFEERRMIGRSFSHDEMTHSDTSDGITEEDSPTAMPLQTPSRFEVSFVLGLCQRFTCAELVHKRGTFELQNICLEWKR